MPRIRVRHPTEQSTLDYATAIQDASELLKLGDRTHSIKALTGLPHNTILMISHDLFGKGPKSGQGIYSDFWYTKTHTRMMHASIIWHLQKKYKDLGLSPARFAIMTYQAYLNIVDVPEISISRALFVPKNVLMGHWGERTCKECKGIYLARVTSRSVICYSCKMHEKLHCEHCGNIMEECHQTSRKRFCHVCSSTKRGRRTRMNHEVVEQGVYVHLTRTTAGFKY